MEQFWQREPWMHRVLASQPPSSTIRVLALQPPGAAPSSDRACPLWALLPTEPPARDSAAQSSKSESSSEAVFVTLPLCSVLLQAMSRRGKVCWELHAAQLVWWLRSPPRI
jgi:hypothetical protein